MLGHFKRGLSIFLVVSLLLAFVPGLAIADTSAAGNEESVEAQAESAESAAESPPDDGQATASQDEQTDG